jgi:hypothetical protein
VTRLTPGVALTTDGGKLFKPVFADLLFTEARYAAFPSDDVWCTLLLLPLVNPRPCRTN